MKMFQAKTKTIAGASTATEFSDYYEADTEAQARQLWDEDCHRYGLPMDKTTVTITEVNTETLKPLTTN